MEVELVPTSVFPCPKNGRSASVTIKEQVTNTAQNMTPLNMCVRVCVCVHARVCRREWKDKRHKVYSGYSRFYEKEWPQLSAVFFT